MSRKKEEIRERRRKQKKQKQMITLGLIIIGAGLVAAAMIYPSLQPNKVELNPSYMADGNAMGNPDAAVTITEYSDYRCGHCGSFASNTKPLLEKTYIETDKVYFISRSVGMMLGSEPSVLATEASYCASEQNKYWEMYDQIFANQAVVFTESLLENWAENADLDMDAYRACVNDDRYDDVITQDQADAEAEGVSGTPSFVISYVVDGKEVKQLIPGDYPFEAFSQAIEQAYSDMGME